MRQLKFHEQRLLRKVDFLKYKRDKNHRVNDIVAKFHLKRTEDYHRYNEIVLRICKLLDRLKALDPADPFRIKQSKIIVDKMHKMGVIKSDVGLQQLSESLSVSNFCRRRLSVILVKLKMAPTIKDAVQFIEQGHIRVGPNVVTDSGFLVTTQLEDFVTWVDTSKIKRHTLAYNNTLDDYELL